MLNRVQQILLDSLLSDDPPATLRQLTDQAADLAEQERTYLRQIDADGFTLSSLLVKKLRFERLTLAHRELAELFDQQPEQFVRLFTAYTSEIPPTAYFPSEEASRYHQWHEQLAAERVDSTPYPRSP